MAGPDDFQVVSLCVEHPDCEKSGKLLFWNNLSQLTRVEAPKCKKCGSMVLYLSRTQLLRKLTENLFEQGTESLFNMAMRAGVDIVSMNTCTVDLSKIQYLLDEKRSKELKKGFAELLTSLRTGSFDTF